MIDWVEAAENNFKSDGKSYIDSEDFIRIYENWLHTRMNEGRLTNLQYLDGLYKVKEARSGKKMSDLL
jgi:hypothetical protein